MSATFSPVQISITWTLSVIISKFHTGAIFVLFNTEKSYPQSHWSSTYRSKTQQ